MGFVWNHNPSKVMSPMPFVTCRRVGDFCRYHAVIPAQLLVVAVAVAVAAAVVQRKSYGRQIMYDRHFKITFKIIQAYHIHMSHPPL